ncbi:DUF427 domain-containing protein [Streptantibioticus ferralitis]|uniref:DUF427 domain-containing protein n=1 Tax=Streptantibioticus ferralitis TaxID=236510 RepID=A0ABT5YWH4_9ACTN|nr:DUF427 domain-containing protein [Streptantibioticus ferralitis]MDF2255767.1 DUF427 domain-containing protein [Streptantibioticus ferralitis]
MTERVHGHRVAAVPSSQHVRVEIDGRVVAETRRPVLVYETGMKVRYYLPPEDVDLTLFEPTDSHTTCPFKGVASYWTYVGDGERSKAHTDVVWAYQDPIPNVEQIKGHLSFYDTVALVAVEGEAPADPAV